MSLMKGLTKSSDNGSNSSNGGGSGNNSDNSALVSLGNTSFGFNFDSEEGTMNNSPRNSNNSEEGDSDGNSNFPGNQAVGSKPKSASSTGLSSADSMRQQSATKHSSATSDSMKKASQKDAADLAVANLQSIAECTNRTAENDTAEKQDLKRKAQDTADNDSGGYNSDDEGRAAEQGASKLPPSEPKEEDDAADSQGEKGSQKGGRKKKKLDDMKREERNAREKERSFRISRQINELRNLLSSGGVIVPKGTKSSVLTEAANYIRMLQQHQYRSEIDRHQLVQQIQMIGGGALGQQAATAVRHVAAQNGVWSLGNFGGVPPKSAMMYHQAGVGVAPNDTPSAPAVQPAQPTQDGTVLPNKIESTDYRFVFNSCTVGMAIASMGGAFIDCNKLFCQLSNFTKQEICSMTIFNLTARQDLQHAFDLISQMLSAPNDQNGAAAMTSCALRGSLKHRNDLGLSVTLIKGEDSVAKCFCVTLVVNPTSPFDNQRPIPATIDCVQLSSQGIPASKDSSGGALDPTPAYTTG